MSPEKQLITIAEACGWKYQGVNAWNVPMGSKPGVCLFPKELPNYLEDLNEIHEAEKQRIRYPESMDFVNHIRDITHRDRTLYVSATAAQRAEAFLKTLGKWESA